MPRLVSLLFSAPATVIKTASSSIQPSSCSVRGGWGHVISGVPPITNIHCCLRKLNETVAEVPKDLACPSLPGVPGPHGGRHGTCWRMREPSPTRRLSPIGTDKHANHRPQRVDDSEWAQRDGGESLCRSPHAFYLIRISSSP